MLERFVFSPIVDEAFIGRAEQVIGNRFSSAELTRVGEMANPVDVHIGERLRARRVAAGLTQNQLGSKVGIAGQQIQKYECGENRISISRMWAIARALDVPMTFFYEGLPNFVTETDAGRGDPRKDKEAREFVKVYFSLPDQHRRQFFNMMNSIANTV